MKKAALVATFIVAVTLLVGCQETPPSDSGVVTGAIGSIAKNPIPPVSTDLGMPGHNVPRRSE